MIPADKNHIPKGMSANGLQGYSLNIPLIQRLRNLNHKAGNIWSTLLVTLFVDFYPTLKH